MFKLNCEKPTFNNKNQKLTDFSSIFKYLFLKNFSNPMIKNYVPEIYWIGIMTTQKFGSFSFFSHLQIF